MEDRMNMTQSTPAPVKYPDRFFIGGQWAEPSSRATIDVIDPANEELFIRISEARDADIASAVSAARNAFDKGPWPRMHPVERADYLRKIAAEMRERLDDLGQIWPRQSGILHSSARAGLSRIPGMYEYYADMADDYPFLERMQPSSGGSYALLAREPVGVVAAIIPWNGPLPLTTYKLAPALLAGCTVILKAAPEAPGEAYIMAEIAEAIGLPSGVLNVLTADRQVSETLVRDSRVDKVAFTGSSAVGRRIASICGERIARCTLELGGKSPAIILDDFDVTEAAQTLAAAGCSLTGQVCASLSRIIVSRRRHDELVEALAGYFSAIRVGNPFDSESQMGPLAMKRQRDRVEGYIAQGVSQGAKLATGGKRPQHLDRGFFIEPTVFGNVQNSSAIAQEEIFGPVLCVIAADDEQHAVEIANNSIYGLNASVFTNDADRALYFARQMRSGTVGHNGFRSDFRIAFGGFKQSGIGREGGREAMRSYLESKTIILEDEPADAKDFP
jgi:aldehyde dehydrogenase (NAD+)